MPYDANRKSPADGCQCNDDYAEFKDDPDNAAEEP